MEQINEMTAKIGEVSYSMVDNVEKKLKVCSTSWEEMKRESSMFR